MFLISNLENLYNYSIDDLLGYVVYFLINPNSIQGRLNRTAIIFAMPREIFITKITVFVIRKQIIPSGGRFVLI